jgi:hypothetical protein
MDSRVVVYDSENDNFSLYDFATTNRYPTGHYWDVEEPKLLAVETRLLETRSNDTSLIEESEDGDEMEVTTLFSSSDDGVLFQSSTRPGRGYEGICGIHVPYLYCYKKINPDSPVPEVNYVESHLLKDFSGLENVDDKSRKALLNFSFFLAVGNMDEVRMQIVHILGQLRLHSCQFTPLSCQFTPHCCQFAPHSCQFTPQTCQFTPHCCQCTPHARSTNTRSVRKWTRLVCLLTR